MTRRVEVLIPKDRVDSGVGKLLPQQQGHLLQVSEQSGSKSSIKREGGENCVSYLVELSSIMFELWGRESLKIKQRMLKKKFYTVTEIICPQL